MWYHAIVDFDGAKRYWWNSSRDQVVDRLLVPFISKQVVSATRKGRLSLFNFGSASYMTILATSKKLSRAAGSGVPSELEDNDFIDKHASTEEFVNELRGLQSAPASRSVIQQALSKPKNQIFVVMKFGDNTLDSAYEGVIKPLGENFGYEVLRVDEIRDSGNITSQILENIACSKLVLVELSGERPNCYYEAGYAHALGKEIIFAIRKGEAIHFDLMGHRFITWDTEANFRSELRKRLQAYGDNESDL